MRKKSLRNANDQEEKVCKKSMKNGIDQEKRSFKKKSKKNAIDKENLKIFPTFFLQ